MGTWAPVDDVRQPCSPPRLSSSRCLVFQSLGNRKCCSIFSTEDGDAKMSVVPGARRPKILQLQKSGDKTGSLLVVWENKVRCSFFSHIEKKRWCICMSENSHDPYRNHVATAAEGTRSAEGVPAALHRPRQNAARCLSLRHHVGNFPQVGSFR